MDVGPQAKAADVTATGVIQATDELTTEGTPTPSITRDVWLFDVFGMTTGDNVIISFGL